MNGVLLDTDVAIEVLRRRNGVLLAQWKRLFETTIRVYYTPVTAAELRQGVRPREEEALSDFLDAVICLPIEADIGLLAGDYLRQFAPSHCLDLGDALIAATAIVHDCTLWTRNRKHYPMKGIEHYHGRHKKHIGRPAG